MRIVIVEDEPAAARQLKKMLERIDGLDIGSLTICSSALEARERLKSGLDLLFLDLNLRGESGFDVVAEFLAEPFDTIITTAYPEHALKAFEIGAVDYLVKPFSQERLEKGVAKIKMRPIPAETMTKILVKERGAIIPAPVDSIAAVRSAGDYTELVMDGGKTLLCSKRMDFLEHKLPEDFMRVHRTAIVRVSRIAELEVESGGKYLAKISGLADTVPVSRKCYKALKEKLAK